MCWQNRDVLSDAIPAENHAALRRGKKGGGGGVGGKGGGTSALADESSTYFRHQRGSTYLLALLIATVQRSQGQVQDHFGYGLRCLDVCI